MSLEEGMAASSVMLCGAADRKECNHELNDSVRVNAEADSCGLPFAVMESVQGRVEDALYLPTVSGGQVAVQPLVFNRVMDIIPVSGWQIAWPADDGLVVLLTGVRDGLADEALQKKLTRSLAQEGVRVPYIRVQRVEAIPKTAAEAHPGNCLSIWTPPSQPP